jgi:transcriptional regulator with XRE-family HTH domain
MNINTVPCKCCEGSGKQIDHLEVSKILRTKRLSLKMKAADVARSMGISRSHLSQLELGQLHWTPEQLAAYEAAINQRIKQIFEVAKTV